MFKGFDRVKAQLAELAPAINAFKSEAVQLRIVDLIFARRSDGDDDPQTDEGNATAKRTSGRRRKSRPKDSAEGAPSPGERRKAERLAPY